MVNKLLIKFDDYLLSALSAVLMSLAFPKLDFWALAWAGLVPLFIALDGKIPQKSFRIAFVHGVIFFSVTLYWLVHVHLLIALVGLPLLVLVLSCYYGLFGLCYSYCYRSKPFVKVLLIPAMWVGIEYLRANLFTGFCWGSIGLSQYKNLLMIQVADFSGVYGVSFVVVMANVLIKDLFKSRLAIKAGTFSRELLISLIIAGAVVAATAVYGIWSLGKVYPGKNVNISVVQANTPQELKWYEPAWPTILLDYMLFTQTAAFNMPDLIIWPETSFPGIIGEDDSKELFSELSSFADEIKVPLLVGSVIKKDKDYYNAGIMLASPGGIVKEYHKLHLVIFGEYVPFRKLFPFISQVVPIADFSAGDEYTLFPLRTQDGEGSGRFGVLICFEDTVASLTRKFVHNGAQLLVNITNDAWFKDSKEPFMHLQSSVFRAVENRRFVVRAANTGISCFINESGKIIRYVSDDHGKKTFVSGTATQMLKLNSGLSFYARFGDVFAYLCFAGVGAFAWGRWGPGSVRL